MNLIELMEVVEDGQKVRIKGKDINCEVVCKGDDNYKYLYMEDKKQFVSEYFSLDPLAYADYEIINEEEKKYYLVLNKCYFKPKRYLAFDNCTNRTYLSEIKKTGNRFKTQFTKQEIKDLIDEFGSDIMDFDRVEVEE